VASKNSNVQRIKVAEIRVVGRATMGVRIMRLAEDDKVIALARLVSKADEKTVVETESKGDALMPEGAGPIVNNEELPPPGEDEQN